MWTRDPFCRLGSDDDRAARFARRGGATNEGGFSLVELLVVLFIVSITASLAAPGVSRWLEDYRVKTTSRQLVSDLQFAKMKAVAEKIEYRVSFEGANRRYRIEKGDSSLGSTTWNQVGIYRSLSDGANPYYARDVGLTDNFANHLVLFSPMGQALPSGAVTFSAADYSRSVSVSTTGRVRIE